MINERQSDEQLWNALREGDQDAFSALYQRFYATLYSYGYKVADNVTLVEDAIQDLFVDLWRMRRSVSGAESVKFYLFRSLRRKIHVLSKKEDGWHFVDTETHAAPESYSAEHPLMQEEEQSQLIERITYALEKLPPRQQEVIALRFYQGFKNEEIARIMGITEKSVRNTLHKALSHLREQAPFLAPLLGFLLWWFS
ncbi:RNA polymerase sigma factor [Siphonobacter aquaeclarae]|uniref:RNA polymerase sigma-70 factor, ECF subfamily n=1 Tax=Siphonobacter aquaeclarae TaxID=563176 RepID=A0A1G9I6L1_9BACT|nr:sigma-70 family RNA polymerase sigma factor [Siphonobacter aquaeclarae]SDL20494.1 RNA polymerase sigma-70 factor, ECF subfamily [Siphonobacter aquaeclarae]